LADQQGSPVIANAKPVNVSAASPCKAQKMPNAQKRGQLANNDAEEKGRTGFPDVELRITYA
jgi:hypothetical protein